MEIKYPSLILSVALLLLLFSCSCNTGASGETPCTCELRHGEGGVPQSSAFCQCPTISSLSSQDIPNYDNITTMVVSCQAVESPVDLSLSDLSSIQSLSLYNCFYVVLNSTFRSLPSLRKLVLDGCDLDNDPCSYFWVRSDSFLGLPNLEELKLLAAADVPKLRGLPSLESLTLAYIYQGVLIKNYTLVIQYPNLLQFTLTGSVSETYKVDVLLLDMPLLERVNITYNPQSLNWIVLPENLFKHTPGLKELSLTHDSIRVLSQLVLHPATNLTKINLSNNNIRYVPPRFFEGQAKLVEVDLSDNQIWYIAYNTFFDLVTMEILDLSNNVLTSLETGTLKGLLNLRIIDMSKNSLGHLPADIFADCTNLTELQISNNNISSLDDTIFHPLTKLEGLYLNYNELQRISGRLFQNQTSLQVLQVGVNRLQAVDFAWFSHMSALNQLLLPINNIQTVSSWGVLKSSFRGNLQVDLVANNINRLPYREIIQLASLGQSKPQLPQVLLNFNPYNCDCEVLPVNQVLSLPRATETFPDLVNISCWNPPELRNLQVSHLPPSSFKCFFKEQCPGSCSCYSQGMKYTDDALKRIVNCSVTGLTQVPSMFPENLTLVDLGGNSFPKLTVQSFSNFTDAKTMILSKNDISTFEPGTFKNMNSVRILYLDGNNISTIEENTFQGLDSLEVLFLNNSGVKNVHSSSFSHLRHLKELHLQDNDLQHLSKETFKRPSRLQVLDIGHNPLMCNCDLLAFKEWAETNVQSVSFDFNVTCGNHGNKLFTSVAHVVKRELSCAPGSQYVYVIIALGMVVAMLVVVLLVYQYRGFLQVWLYMKCGWRFDPKDDGDDKTYDAFISYSSRDELVVIRELAPGLEERGFNLCLHYRDFPVGACIATTIIETVETSSRTIILLSQNFVDSEWCALEFKAAHRQVLEDRRNRIVVIVLDDLELQNVDKDLQFYLKTNTYLKWGDPWFWSKLCYALPRVGRGADKQSSDSEHIDMKDVTSQDSGIEMTEIYENKTVET
ncbi:toll-like receptor Tollo [Branchiostoma lanceolatum]|uniref:toll-like receptor Tollo n=1 Tax=Branchiostoma lanceolatum TaxID=7740 RepID=UPI003454C758